MSAVKDKSIITKICFAAIFVVVILVFGVLNEYFLTANTFLTILKNVSVIAIAALGLTFVIAVGQTDMSFYLVACFSAMLMSWVISLGVPAVAAVLIGLLGAFACGFAGGISVGVFRLPDIIITIAIGTIAFGCAYLFSDGQKIYDNMASSGIGFLNDGNVGGIPTPIFFMLIFYVIVFIFLEKTKYGTFIYATGSNRVAARFSGINIAAVVISAYVICILLSSFAGMINTASKGMGDVKQSLSFLMPCFTAVFIGRAIFKRPNVVGTFLGAFLVQIMTTGIIMTNVPYYIGDLITGGLLIVSLLISTLNHSDSVPQPKLLKKKAKEGVTS